MSYLFFFFWSKMKSIINNLQIRADLFFAVRCFFREKGFLEVETPYRIPSPLPEAHIDAQEAGDWFLHPSPESCMKRLLSAGHENIFQICKVFRQGERGEKHLPEFTMLEWYCAGADYTLLMDQCEELVTYCADAVLSRRDLTHQGNSINLQKPWPRITVKEAFDRYGSMDVSAAVKQDKFDEIMAFEIEPALGVNPVFLVDYPIEKASLARPKPGGPDVAERFELYIGGMELANAFSELTDPAMQKVRFAEEEKIRRTLGKPPYPAPDKFLDDLARMPESAGIALGMDRLAMLFADAQSIDQVSAFTPEDL